MTPFLWALLLASCTRPNPGFGSGSVGETTQSSTGTTMVATTSGNTSDDSESSPTVATTLGSGSDTTTDGPTTDTSGTVDPTTDTSGTVDPTTDDPTTDGPTTEDPTTEDPTTGTDTDTETDSDSDTDGPPACDIDPEEYNCAHEYLGDEWYLFCQTPVTWDQARMSCTTLCSHLVVVSDENQSNALHDRLLEPAYVPANIPENPNVQPDQPDASRWIGARRINGQLVWSENEPNAFDNWAGTEPDFNGDCVVIAVVGKDEGDGQWYDRSCDGYNYPFICSYE